MVRASLDDGRDPVGGPWPRAACGTTTSVTTAPAAPSCPATASTASRTSSVTVRDRRRSTGSAGRSARPRRSPSSAAEYVGDGHVGAVGVARVGPGHHLHQQRAVVGAAGHRPDAVERVAERHDAVLRHPARTSPSTRCVPFAAAGPRTEPPVSVPSPPSASPAATAMPVPELDPEALWSVFHGFRGIGKPFDGSGAPQANSLVVLLPTMIATDTAEPGDDRRRRRRRPTPGRGSGCWPSSARPRWR